MVGEGYDVRASGFLLKKELTYFNKVICKYQFMLKNTIKGEF